MNDLERMQVEGWAEALLTESLDVVTGEYNATVLAELIAIEMNRTDWLDDPEHELWTIAANATNC